MDILPYDAAKWLIIYKALPKHEPPSRQILETIRDHTYDNRLHTRSSAHNSPIFRGVRLEQSGEWLLNKIVNDAPVVLKTKPYESWTLTYWAAQRHSGKFSYHSDAFGKRVSIVLFNKKPNPRSIVANMAHREWWDDYLDVWETLEDPSFSKASRRLAEKNLVRFVREAELLVYPQCDKCDFKKNVAWILAPLSFWVEYSERSDVRLVNFNARGMDQRTGYVDLSDDPSIFYFGAYNPREGVVELYEDENGDGDFWDDDGFEKFVNQRVG